MSANSHIDYTEISLQLNFSNRFEFRFFPKLTIVKFPGTYSNQLLIEDCEVLLSDGEGVSYIVSTHALSWV